MNNVLETIEAVHTYVHKTFFNKRKNIALDSASFGMGISACFFTRCLIDDS